MINVLKNLKTITALLIIIIYLINSRALAMSWSSDFTAKNGEHWSIERQSSGIGMMESNSDIRGSITPIRVTPSGRIAKSVASKYSRIMVDDVGSEEKLSAFEGRITIQDGLFFYYNDTEGYEMTATGIAGHYHSEDHEYWPVFLTSRNVVNYKGSEINDLSDVINTYDRIGEKLLYNKNFQKDLYVRTYLDRFNVTLDIVNDSISAEIQPTKRLDYILNTKTSGIADLFAGIVDTKFDVKHQNYPYSMQNEERYVGSYNIQRRIQVNSTFITPSDKDIYPGEDWLPCSLCLNDGFEFPDYLHYNTFEDLWGM